MKRLIVLSCLLTSCANPSAFERNVGDSFTAILRYIAEHPAEVIVAIGGAYAIASDASVTRDATAD